MKKTFVCILTRRAFDGNNITDFGIMIVTEKKKTARQMMTKMVIDDMEYDKMTKETYEKDRIILKNNNKTVEYRIEEEEVR